MADLFISYSRNDAAKVEALAAILERAGWSVWWDQRITTGSSFDMVIEQALAEAKAVIVAWSRNSVGSEWVRAEAAFAIDKKKLIPVRLDESVPPLRFTNIQTVDLSGWDQKEDSAAFQRLIADLTQLLGPPPAKGAAAAPGAVLAAAARTTAPPLRPARRARAAAVAFAALVVLAGAGAVLALRGGAERNGAKEQVATAEAGKAISPRSVPAASTPTAPKGETPAPPPPAQAAALPPAAVAPKETPAPAAPPPPAVKSEPPAPPAESATVSNREVELAFWKSIKDSTMAADFDAYLEKYPNGDFAAVARNRLASLKPAETPAMPPPAPQTPPAKTGPELEVLDTAMVAARGAPLRETPDIRGKQIGRVKEGERLQVAGKVKGADWYAVEIKGDVVAYVATAALEDAAAYQEEKEKEREKEKQREQREKEQQSQQQAPAPQAALAPKATMMAPPAPTGVSAFNGIWRGRIACEPGPQSKAPAFANSIRPFTFADGRISGEFDTFGFGAGGHEVYEGSVDADGRVAISGHGSNSKFGKYSIEFNGTIKGGLLDGTGRMGYLICTMSYRHF